MAEDKHTSPSGLELPNPQNSIDHKDAGPFYPVPDEVNEDE